MKLIAEKRDVQATGVLAKRTFHLAMGPKIMEILAGQYSDLVLAVVREYMTNMIDAYRGMDRETIRHPELHLPTEMQSWIEFKDFGCGMDYDTVWNVFTGFGVSTKNEDDDTAGGFGIGAKVCFAFMRAYGTADQWTVESRYEGERMIFSVTKDEEGMPAMYHVATVETDEPNGVTVKGSVPTHLMEDFARQAEYVLSYYPIPVVMTGHAVKQGHEEYTMHGEDWGMILGRGRESRVIMGSVPYPLNIQKLVNRKILHGEASYSTFDLYVPIGAVDLTPSRESLEYSDRTFDALAQVVAKMDASLLKVVNGKIDDCETEWEAMIEAQRLSGDPLIKRVLQKVVWRGKEINLNEGVSITLKEIMKLGADRVEILTALSNECAVFRQDALGEKLDTKLSVSVRNQNLIVLINDVARGEVSRSKEALLNKHAPRHGWKSPKRSPGWNKTTGYLIHLKDGVKVEKFIKKLRGKIGGAPLGLPLSEVAMPERGKGTRKGGKAFIKKLTGSGFEEWDNEMEDEEVTGVYVRAEGSQLMDYGEREVARSLWRNLHLAGLVPYNTPLLVVPRSRAAVEKAEGTEELTAFAKRVVAAQMQKLAVARMNTLILDRVQINDNLIWNLIRTASFLPATHPVRQMAKQVEEVQKLDQNNLGNLIMRLGLKWPSVKPTLREAGLVKVMDRYPMLELVGYHTLDTHKDTHKALDYIKMVDTMRWLEGQDSKLFAA